MISNPLWDHTVFVLASSFSTQRWTAGRPSQTSY